MKKILKIVFVIIGTLIGAGFASGQEMYIFFFSYGKEGLIGIIVSSILIGIIINKSLYIVHKYKIKTYKQYLEVFFKAKSDEKYFNFKNIINIIINIFIFVTFCIMIAGFGAYFEQQIGINKIIGSIILSSLSFIIFMKSIKGVVKVNEILVPILIIFIIIVGLVTLINIDFKNFGDYLINTNKSNSILSAILYSSYNSILLIPVLITLRDYIINRKQIRKISILTTLIIILLSSIIFLLLTKVDVDITKLQMPAVYVVNNMSKILGYGYGFIILGSIFTTSVSLGTSFLQNVTNNKKRCESEQKYIKSIKSEKHNKSYTQIAVIMCITSVIVSKFGFSNLINALYPIFGYLGLLQILANILKKT